MIDRNKEEFLAIGKGIGFSKKKGDLVNIKKDVKIYPMNYSEQDEKFIGLINEIPDELVLVIEDTIKGAEEILEAKLNYTLIFTLSSHLYYALQREESFESVNLPFNQELGYMFPKEYAAAEYSIDYLRTKYNYDLNDGEAVFFTFHFVNALQGVNMNYDALKTGSILNDIIDILENEKCIEIDKNSIHFSRFIIHIRYFLIRQYENNLRSNDRFTEISDYMVIKFEEAAKVVKKIKDLLSNKYNIYYSEEENLYLLLHVQRLLEEN